MNISKFKNDVAFSGILLVFIVYLTTICPTVFVGDSGELTTAAFSLGVPHPSGYPLYSMIGKIFCLIPFGDIAFRMNLMSVFFSVTTIWIVYSITIKLTESVTASISAALLLAFSLLYWGQTVCAEVYSLHIFFISLLIRLLFYYDESGNVNSLLLLAFVLGLSFCNHLQTLMVIPSFLLFILMSDKKTLTKQRLIVYCCIIFLTSLTIYLYLPIRTHAESAIHWGDPDNIKNFLAVVTGKGHREGYVFNSGFLEYIFRMKDAVAIVFKQFGIISLISVWGFIIIKVREKIFFLTIILFDFFYTVFLNTVNLEITPFNLITIIVFAILLGIGYSDIIKRFSQIPLIQNKKIFQIFKMAILFIPFIFLISNYPVCDQSRNYAAREHAVNIFRTVNYKGTVLVAGDNNLFPVTYTRVIERMREDVSLYDQYNLFFKMPYMGDQEGTFTYYGKWDDVSSLLQQKIVQKKIGNGVYYAVFNPYTISLPEKYYLIPYGIVSQVVSENPEDNKIKRPNIWKYYMSQSYEDDFYRDYMTREVTSHFYFYFGKELILSGNKTLGLERVKLASQIAYDSDLIHMALVIFLIDTGFFEEAKDELEKSVQYSDDLSVVYNNWGHYYAKKGEIDNAIDSLRKAVKINPEKTIYYNNLGDLLLKSGRKKEAVDVFRKSLKIDQNQDQIKKILQDNDMGKVNIE